MFGETEVDVGEVDEDGYVGALLLDAGDQLAVAGVDVGDVAEDLGNAHDGYVFGADDAGLAGLLHVCAAEAGEGGGRETLAQGGDEGGAVVVAGGFAGGEEDARVGDGRDWIDSKLAKASSSEFTIAEREAIRMSDVITGFRQVIQDLVAPDLKAHTAKLEALQKQSEVQHDAVMTTLDAFRAEMRAEFASLRANNQVEVFRQVTPMNERLAVVEARTKQG